MTLLRVFLMLALVQLSGANMEECPEGWIQQDGDCFRMLHSPDFLGFRSVYEARSTCNLYGADIASFKSRDMYPVVFEMIRGLEEHNAIKPQRAYIGLNDIIKEGQYVWIDGNESDYKMWATGEPNNIFNNNEDCVLLESEGSRWYDDGGTGWKDYPCCRGERINAVICQRGINDSGEVLEVDYRSNIFARACFSGVNECASSPCSNHGKCYDEFLDYRCVCPAGLTGKNCDEDLHCKPLQSWRDYNISTTNTLYKTVLNYTCSTEHYVFPDGSIFLTSVCNGSGEWEPSIEDCISPERERKTIKKRYIKPTEAEGASAVGFIALLFVGIEVSFLIILDLQYFIHHLTPLVLYIRNKLRWNRSSELLDDATPREMSMDAIAIPSTSKSVMSEMSEDDIGNGIIESKF